LDNYLEDINFKEEIKRLTYIDIMKKYLFIKSLPGEAPERIKQLYGITVSTVMEVYKMIPDDVRIEIEAELNSNGFDVQKYGDELAEKCIRKQEIAQNRQKKKEEGIDK